MKKPAASPDNTIAYIAVALVLVVLAAAIAWFYMGNARPAAPTATFTKVGPLDFKVEDQSARITMDLQSSSDDVRWAKQNQGALERVIDHTLADLDPALMKAPNDVKFTTIQTALAKEINRNFPEAKIDKVYVTDYVSAQN